MRIDVENLCFSYAVKPVLEDICFHVSKGEIVCLVGPNGSGKSTLIKCIESLLKIRSGRILLDGDDTRTLVPAEMARRIGYVSQSATLGFATTVFETVLMGRRPHSTWRNSNKDIQVVIDILEQMDLEQCALQNVNRLSGGQRQRVFIARALAQEPRALLLDEPTSALDIPHQMDIMDIVRTLARTKGISVIMVLHDLNLAARYADRIIMLNRGSIHAEGSPEHVFTQRNMETVYGVEAAIQRDEKGVVYILPISRCCPGSLQGKRGDCG